MRSTTPALIVTTLLALSSTLTAAPHLLTPQVDVAVPSGLPDPLDVATALHDAPTWTDRYLALASYFQPTLQPPPLHIETRSVADLIGLTYTQLGTDLTPNQAAHIEAQLTQLPPAVTYALQQVLGAILLSITTWHLATATLTPEDWQVLAKYDPDTTTEDDLLTNYAEFAPVAEKIDAALIQTSAAHLLATLDHVTPILEEALTHPLLQQPRAVPPFPGPNEGILFNDPFNVILVGDITKSVYYGNTWPFPTFAEREHLLIIDLAGDDEYRNHPARADPGLCNSGIIEGCNNSFTSILLDITGNDQHLPYFIGGSVAMASDGGIAILLDAAGNDRYTGTNFGGSSLGFAFAAGVALLLDTTGNDVYVSSTTTQGAARGNRAVGMLFDATGNDLYHGGWNSQGITSVQGYGFHADLQGDDLVNSGRWAQGRALAGGVGFYLNLGGNDIYNGMEWSRGYTLSCWQDPSFLPIPDCPNDLDDFAAIFMDICGTDSYTGWLGNNDEFWQQSDFGRGIDQRNLALCTGNE